MNNILKNNTIESNSIEELDSIDVVSQIYNHVGYLLISKDKFLISENYFYKALEIDNKNYKALNNLGIISILNNKLEQALFYLNKSLFIKKDDAITKYNLALVFLKQNKYRLGFKYYSSIYNFDKELSFFFNHSNRLQEFNNVHNKVIFILNEQGIGDMIQFIRFLPYFESKANEIICGMPQVLIKIFKYNYPKINFISKPNKQRFQYHFPLIYSANLLNIRYEDIPYRNSYLKINTDDSKSIYNKYFINNMTIKVGIIWRSNFDNTEKISKLFERRKRNTTLKQFLKYFKNKNAQLYSLQVDTTNEEKELLSQNNILSLGDDFKDFYDNALVIDNLDLVIGIDTTSIQLSGAMGKPTIVLVPFSCDWRWGIEGKKTNWYNSITICRQKVIGDWDSTFIEAKEELDEFIKKS